MTTSGGLPTHLFQKQRAETTIHLIFNAFGFVETAL
jgi:hypothetical protein